MPLSKMVEADRPGKLFIGGLSIETNEKILQDIFGKFGEIEEVLLMKDRKTNKSRGFAFITFENPVHANVAAKELNNKELNGKTIKVEQAIKSKFAPGGRQRIHLSTNRGSPRSLSCRRGDRGVRGYTSCERHLGDGGYSVNLTVSSSRGPFPFKRGPFSRSGGPPPKRSAPSGSIRSHSRMEGRDPVSRGGKKYGSLLHREPTSSQRDGYVAPRNSGYSTHNSDRGGYVMCRDGVESGRPSGGSYRHYQSVGSSHSVTSTRGFRLTDIGRRYDYGKTRDGYGANRESHRGSQSGRERGGRHERGLPPSVDRKYRVSQKNSSASYRASRNGHREYQSERGG